MRKHILTIGLVLALGALGFAQRWPGSRAQQTQTQQQGAVQITQGPMVESTGSNQAVVAWSTNVSAGSQVKYGTNPNNLVQTAQAPWGGMTHRVTIRNLQPNTTYYFQVVSGHAAGSGAMALSQISQFQTQGSQGTNAGNTGSWGQDNTPNDNTIGQVRPGDRATDNVRILAGPVVQNVQGNTATLWWQTDDVAATDVRYGLSPSNMDQRAYERGGSRDHRAQLTNLQPGRTYYYEIMKRHGSVRTTGQFNVPMNGQLQQSGAAQITNGPVLEYLGQNNAVVSWSTAAPASSIVRYGTDPNSLTQTAQAPWGSTNHRVQLNNLQPNTQYYFQVISAQSQSGGMMAQSYGQFHTMSQGQQALTITPR